MKKKQSGRRFSHALLAALTACALMLSLIMAPVYAVNGGIEYPSKGYTIEKLSHPDRGEGEVDGILTGENEDRSQSYAWSMVEYGDDIYIGTCYNPIYGIYYRNILNMFTGIFGAEKASEIAQSLVDLMYDEAFDHTLVAKAAIIKVNKYTYEPTLVYRYEEPGNNMSGYRMAMEFNGKLYFVGSGYPTACLLEIDPENGDAVDIVYERTVEDRSVASGIHGLAVFDGQLLMAIATDQAGAEDGVAGARIIASSDPSSDNWETIGNQEDFLDIPAYYIRDGINGGGLWELMPYNGSLYVTAVSSKTDAVTGETTKTGFALFKGDKNEKGNWSWNLIAGNEEDGAQLPYGFGVNEATTCNMFVYDGYLYFGAYNDPMLDLAVIPAEGNFERLYNDLASGINLYRMDAQGNFELVGGKPNEVFPEVTGNLGVGLGNHTNQYVWRFGEHNGDLYIGTFDAATLIHGFTQLTDGSLLGMTKEEFIDRVNQVIKVLQAFLRQRSASVDSADISSMISDLSSIVNEAEGISTMANGEEKTPVDRFNDFVAMYERISKWLPSFVTGPIDEFLNNNTVRQFVYYFGVNYYSMRSVPGFDMLKSTDGVNFETITNDGFGDQYNHGLRTFESTDQGIFIGTANCFYGAQLWLVNDQTQGSLNSSINPTKVTYDVQKPADVEVKMNLLGNTLEKVQYQGKDLQEGTDYTVNHGLLTLSKDFLNTLNVSRTPYDITFVFSAGENAVLKVTVVDSSESESSGSSSDSSDVSSDTSSDSSDVSSDTSSDSSNNSSDSSAPDQGEGRPVDPSSSGNSNNPTSGTADGTNTSSNKDTPNTGDKAAILPILLLSASCVGILATTNRGRGGKRR